MFWLLAGFFYFFLICPHVYEHKYNSVWYVWEFETTMSEDFYVTNEVHFWIEFISVICISWYTWDKRNVRNFTLHLTFHMKPADSRVLSTGSILYIVCSLQFVVITAARFFCRFLHLYVFHSCCETQRLKSLNYLGWVSSFSASGIQVQPHPRFHEPHFRIKNILKKPEYEYLHIINEKW